MSIAHLHYALKEIDLISRLTTIKNSTFVKRSISRLIAIRVDDFIRIGFIANRQTVNSQKIRDELNALQSLYRDHFILQRDKYAAHFQHLDFASRLQNWAEINLDKATFFTDMPKEIYLHFSGASSYVPFDEPVISTASQTIIEQINEQYDLESYPSFATDILALTRPNSGGILNFSMIHTKAGVLKSLELLLEYEWAVLSGLTGDAALRRPFIKLFVTDLQSYADNYFTRTDITVSAQQYEEGLDFYLAEEPEFAEGNKLVSELKLRFRLTEHITELRTIRNTVCGHIDIGHTPQGLDTIIDGVDLDRFYDFYVRLKNVFRSVCQEILCLGQYLIDPYERVHGVLKIAGMDVKSFDGSPFPEKTITHRSPNDIAAYQEMFKQWLLDRNEEARSYFWNCFTEAQIEEPPLFEDNGVDHDRAYRRHRYRRIHTFFEAKLADSGGVATEEKVAIIDLFVRCQSSDPETSAYVLERTYPKDINLQAHYLQAMGKLSATRSAETLSRCLQMFQNTNLQGKCISLKALFRIDLTARRNSTGKHTPGDSAYSACIKQLLQTGATTFEKLSLSLSLVSDYVFGRHYLSDSLDEFYKDFFIEMFSKASDKLLSPYLRIGDNRTRLTEIQGLVRTNRFATLVAAFAEFLKQKNFEREATLLRTLLVQDHISYARNDNQELHNLAVVYFQLDQLETAIEIARFLSEKNAHVMDYMYLLLDLYRHDEKYRDEFEVIKKKVLTTFNLTEEERSDVEKLKMNEPLKKD